MNTSKMHRHALHSKLDNIDANGSSDVRLRGQTAGVGIRLNPKLAGQLMRNNISSQSNVGGNGKFTMRGAYSGRESQELMFDKTTAASHPMTKSGFTYYPGQPLKVS